MKKIHSIFRYSALKSLAIPPKLEILDGSFSMNSELETFTMNNKLNTGIYL